MALEECGYITREELEQFGLFPSEERFKQGPVAVIECIQEIPCNPCEAACPRNAIQIGAPITTLPMLNEKLCTGCGICIAKCPGLAIFTVDKTYSGDEATVSFPYEYVPLPVKDEIVEAVNRVGEVVCKGRIIKVLNPKAYDRTPVVTVAIEKEFADEVRSMKRK
ncbi:MAG: 4Fe-4S ferredoxin [Bacillota bacterium]|nr:4Fe-4S ferredoxin [Bacillota bacterium]